MAFKINHTPEFQRKAEIHVPADDGHDIQTIDVTYIALPDSELAGFDMLNLEGQKDLLRRVVVSVGDVLDDSGKLIPFSPDLLEQIMGWSNARLALMKTYSKALSETHLGN